jgi:hypothetical protein
MTVTGYLRRPQSDCGGTIGVATTHRGNHPSRQATGRSGDGLRCAGAIGYQAGPALTPVCSPCNVSDVFRSRDQAHHVTSTTSFRKRSLRRRHPTYEHLHDTMGMVAVRHGASTPSFSHTRSPVFSAITRAGHPTRHAARGPIIITETHRGPPRSEWPLDTLSIPRGGTTPCHVRLAQAHPASTPSSHSHVSSHNCCPSFVPGYAWLSVPIIMSTQFVSAAQGAYR